MREHDTFFGKESALFWKGPISTSMRKIHFGARIWPLLKQLTGNIYLLVLYIYIHIPKVPNMIYKKIYICIIYIYMYIYIFIYIFPNDIIKPFMIYIYTHIHTYIYIYSQNSLGHQPSFGAGIRLLHCHKCSLLNRHQIHQPYNNKQRRWHRSNFSEIPGCEGKWLWRHSLLVTICKGAMINQDDRMGAAMPSISFEAVWVFFGGDECFWDKEIRCCGWCGWKRMTKTVGFIGLILESAWNTPCNDGSISPISDFPEKQLCRNIGNRRVGFFFVAHFLQLDRRIIPSSTAMQLSWGPTAGWRAHKMWYLGRW